LIATADSKSTGEASGTLFQTGNYGWKSSAKAFGLSRSPVAYSVSSSQVSVAPGGENFLFEKIADSLVAGVDHFPRIGSVCDVASDRLVQLRREQTVSFLIVGCDQRAERKLRCAGVEI
jgi:hypothetical protein